ncbi:zinc finger protein 189-like, partial [Liolophura sinensis]|uniref:zinc finger protein 189-like n=1 Tax=Liolophura sinensis TaxID=3198878 RepID=UPI003158F3E8
FTEDIGLSDEPLASTIVKTEDINLADEPLTRSIVKTEDVGLPDDLLATPIGKTEDVHLTDELLARPIVKTEDINLDEPLARPVVKTEIVDREDEPLVRRIIKTEDIDLEDEPLARPIVQTQDVDMVDDPLARPIVKTEHVDLADDSLARHIRKSEQPDLPVESQDLSIVENETVGLQDELWSIFETDEGSFECPGEPQGRSIVEAGKDKPKVCPTVKAEAADLQPIQETVQVYRNTNNERLKPYEGSHTNRSVTHTRKLAELLLPPGGLETKSTSCQTEYDASPVSLEEVMDTMCQTETDASVLRSERLREKQITCNICGMNLTHSLEDHMKKHPGLLPFTCILCKQDCKNPSGLKVHMRVHTGDKPYTCTICKRKFRALGALKSHLKIHSDIRPYACTDCNKTFKNLAALKPHMRLHTGERPFSCNLCEKRFIQSCNLKMHMRSHKNDKANMCDICGKKFAQPYELKTHSRTHTDDKRPYSCDVCEKTFSTSASYNDHVKWHIRKRLNMSSVSKRTFKQQSQSKMQKHTGRNQYTCNICGKNFAREGNLWNHQKRQNCESSCQGFKSRSKASMPRNTTDIPDVMPPSTESAGMESLVSQPETSDYVSTIHETKITHSCSVMDCMGVQNGENCNSGEKFEQSFKDSNGLKTLFRPHASDKSYACNLCERKFTRESDLKAHIKIHTLQRKQTCGICRKTFKRFAEFKKHLKRHASEEAEIRDGFSEESLRQKLHSKQCTNVHSSEDWIEDRELSPNGPSCIERMQSCKGSDISSSLNKPALASHDKGEERVESSDAPQTSPVFVTECVDIATERVDVATEHVDIATERVDVMTERFDGAIKSIDGAIKSIDGATERVDIATEHVDVITEPQLLIVVKAEDIYTETVTLPYELQVCTNKKQDVDDEFQASFCDIQGVDLHVKPEVSPKRNRKIVIPFENQMYTSEEQSVDFSNKSEAQFKRNCSISVPLEPQVCSDQQQGVDIQVEPEVWPDKNCKIVISLESERQAVGLPVKIKQWS